jgi:hypothetical protein
LGLVAVSVHTVTVVIADLALLLAVPACLIALAAVALLGLRHSVLHGARRCPHPGEGAR